MKEFDIRPQVKLPASKCMEVVLSGLRFRLFRASITMAIIALAVAFLMTILGDSMIVRAVGRSVETLIRPRQNCNFWVSRLSRPTEASEATRILSRASPGDDRWEEFKAWSGATDEEMVALQASAEKETRYLSFFADLKESQIRRLAERDRGRDIFVRLSDPDTRRAFAETLPEIGALWPGTFPEFERFLEQWPALRSWQNRVAAGHRQALAGVRALLGARTVREYLERWDEEAIGEFHRLGFRLRPDDVQDLREWARRQAHIRAVEQPLQDPAFRQRFASRFGIKDLNRIAPDLFHARLAARGGAEWLVATLGEMGSPPPFPAEDARATARAWLRDRRLAVLESSVLATGASAGFMGFSNRVLWLIGVSLIVCVVGIANAMLMSVTERFKEIATMKCLGATDGFIMTNFMMESGFQGLTGGIIGGLIGLVLGIVRATLGYGIIALASLPAGELGLVFLLSVAAGIVLSVLAAIYPALAAARLAPLEAMRVE